MWMDEYKNNVNIAWNLPFENHGIDIGDVQGGLVEVSYSTCTPHLHSSPCTITPTYTRQPDPLFWKTDKDLDTVFTFIMNSWLKVLMFNIVNSEIFQFLIFILIVG